MDAVLFEEAMALSDEIKRDLFQDLTEEEMEGVRMGSLDFELYEGYCLDHIN